MKPLLIKQQMNLEKLKPCIDRIKAGEPFLFVTLADSNTNNTHFSNGAKQWPELLAAELKSQYKTQRVLVLNAGVSGDSIREAMARFDTDVARFRPELTILSLGSNDSKRLTDDEFREGLNCCFGQLADLGSAVLLLTPTPVKELEPAPPHIWKGDDQLRAKVAVLREFAVQRGVAMVDIYEAWQEMDRAGTLDISTLTCDEVHLNADGHALIFRQLAPAFGLSLQ